MKKKKLITLILFCISLVFILTSCEKVQNEVSPEETDTIGSFSDQNIEQKNMIGENGKGDIKTSLDDDRF